MASQAERSRGEYERRYRDAAHDERPEVVVAYVFGFILTIAIGVICWGLWGIWR